MEQTRSGDPYCHVPGVEAPHASAGESEPGSADGLTSGTSAVDAASGQRSVQSVEVGGRLLLALADSRSDLSLKDLAARAGLTPSRATTAATSRSA